MLRARERKELRLAARDFLTFQRWCCERERNVLSARRHVFVVSRKDSSAGAEMPEEERDQARYKPKEHDYVDTITENAREKGGKFGKPDATYGEKPQKLTPEQLERRKKYEERMRLTPNEKVRQEEAAKAKAAADAAAAEAAKAKAM